jgi:hypothetical protein
LFTLTACGGGGSSGWSKTDERRFVNDGTVEQGFDEETVDCFLQFARDDFDTYDEYVKATRLGRCHRSREALHERGHRRVPRGRCGSPDVDRGARVTSAVMAEDMSEDRIQAHVVSTAIALIVLILLWGYGPVAAMLCASLLFVLGYLIAKSL